MVIAHEAPLTAGFAGEVTSTIQVWSHYYEAVGDGLQL